MASPLELPDIPDLLGPQRNALYNYDADAQKSINTAKPWKTDIHHFQKVRISAAALTKMVMHARVGGEIEVMGLMQGYVDGPALIITDAFRLPVEGTETRVNAQEDANEYMVSYLIGCREEPGGGGRPENVVGWYHSHPGYGCWLSGIDVATQSLQQQFQDPFVAVVIDPHRTISSGKVDIGAFRTYPQDYVKPHESGKPDSYIPFNKAADFGAHADKYYKLEVEHFKSTLDDRLLESLWNRYWVQTVSQNPLLTNRDYATNQMTDLALKTAIAAGLVEKAKGGGGYQQGGGAAAAGGGSGVSSTYAAPSTFGVKGADKAVSTVTADARGIAAKEEVGLVASKVKAIVFKPTGSNGRDEDLALE